MVRVVLNNHLGFCEERYGAQIVLVKRIRRTGVRLVCVRDGKDEEMRVQDMHELLKAYNLQFDNPLNFLTQEQSRRLLGAATPEQLYDFYYRGSGFQSINEEIQEGMERLEAMNALLAETEAAYARTVEALERSKRSLEFVSEDYEGKLRELSAEEEATRLAEQLSRAAEWRRDIEALERRMEELNREKAELQGSDGEEAIAVEYAAEVRKKVAELEQEIASLEIRCHGLENEHKEFETDLGEAEDLIIRIRAKDQTDILIKKDEKTEGAIRELKNRIKAVEEAGSGLSNAAYAEEEANKKKQERQYILERQIAYLRKNSKDSDTAAVTEQHRRMAAAIKGTVFQDRVIGPVSSHVKLKDQRWFRPVSILLKRSLNNYLVFNQQDRNRMMEIVKRLNVSFSVSLLPRGVNNTSKPMGNNLHINNKKKFTRQLSGNQNPNRIDNQGQDTTMLDVLEISEESVETLLIAFHNIDRILLIADRITAYSRVREEGQNIDCAYTMDGGKIKLTKGSLSDYKARNTGSFWFEDSESKISSMQEEMRRLGQNSTAQKQLIEYTKQIKAIQDEMQQLDAEWATIRTKLRSRAAYGEENTAALEKKAAGLRRRIGALKPQMQEAIGAREEKSRERERLVREAEEAEHLRAARTAERVKALQVLEHKQMIGDMEKKKFIISLSGLEKEINAKIREINNQHNSYNECRENKTESYENNSNCSSDPNKGGLLCQKGGATKRGRQQEGLPGNPNKEGESTEVLPDACDLSTLPESYQAIVRNPRAIKEVFADKAAIKEHIRTKASMRPVAQIRQEHSALMKERNKHARIKNQYSESVHGLNASYNHRLSKRDEIKLRKTEEAAALFAEYTARAGYQGHLVFNHDKQLLTLTMRVHNAAHTGTKATLSGGERSFASVCFLLSLWRSFRCPVKVLDEFDVFMDAVNRRTAISAFLEFFNENDMQAILITPLSTADLANSDVDIKVIVKE